MYLIITWDSIFSDNDNGSSSVFKCCKNCWFEPEKIIMMMIMMIVKFFHPKKKQNNQKYEKRVTEKMKFLFVFHLN